MDLAGSAAPEQVPLPCPSARMKPRRRRSCGRAAARPRRREGETSAGEVVASRSPVVEGYKRKRF
uniref:Uncharacterized protein n=1 Tax=Oryza nivara TaxID=4536 RepID=A0A0E0GPS4_ORYNI